MKTLSLKTLFLSLILLTFALAFTACGETADTSDLADSDQDVTIETTTTEPDPTEDWTAEQRNCYMSAQNYLDMGGFSYQGLIDQLSSEYADNYPKDVAEFVVGYLDESGEVDWVEQAEIAARNYLETSGFSREGLIEQLTSEYADKFTQEQAEKAVENVYDKQ